MSVEAPRTAEELMAIVNDALVLKPIDSLGEGGEMVFRALGGAVVLVAETLTPGVYHHPKGIAVVVVPEVDERIHDLFVAYGDIPQSGVLDTLIDRSAHRAVLQESLMVCKHTDPAIAVCTGYDRAIKPSQTIAWVQEASAIIASSAAGPAGDIVLIDSLAHPFAAMESIEPLTPTIKPQKRPPRGTSPWPPQHTPSNPKQARRRR